RAARPPSERGPGDPTRRARLRTAQLRHELPPARWPGTDHRHPRRALPEAGRHPLAGARGDANLHGRESAHGPALPWACTVSGRAQFRATGNGSHRTVPGAARLVRGGRNRLARSGKREAATDPLVRRVWHPLLRLRWSPTVLSARSLDGRIAVRWPPYAAAHSCKKEEGGITCQDMDVSPRRRAGPERARAPFGSTAPADSGACLTSVSAPMASGNGSAPRAPAWRKYRRS